MKNVKNSVSDGSWFNWNYHCLKKIVIQQNVERPSSSPGPKFVTRNELLDQQRDEPFHAFLTARTTCPSSVSFFGVSLLRVLWMEILWVYKNLHNSQVPVHFAYTQVTTMGFIYFIKTCPQLIRFRPPVLPSSGSAEGANATWFPHLPFLSSEGGGGSRRLTRAGAEKWQLVWWSYTVGVG